MATQITAKVEEVFLLEDGRTIFAIVISEIKSLPPFKGVLCRFFINNELHCDFCIYLELFAYNRNRPEMFCIGTHDPVDIDKEIIANNDCHVEFLLEDVT